MASLGMAVPVRLTLLPPQIVLATYEEWQKGALNSKPPNNGRVSSAVFLKDRSRPNGLMWLHVHETWLPEAVVSADPFSF